MRFRVWLPALILAALFVTMLVGCGKGGGGS
jgi:hypothetical protein